MLRFFRKIRIRLLKENKVGKYLLYAIGEIVLIVIGILIALSINNWNNSRNALKQEAALYIQLIDDLETDKAKLEMLLSEFMSFDSTHVQIFKEINGESQYNARIPYYSLRQGTRFNPLISANFKNSLTSISDPYVRGGINHYINHEAIALEAISFSNNIRRGDLRSFLMEHDIVNVEPLYRSEQFMWTNESIKYDNLKLQYGSVELNQILGNLKMNNEWAQDQVTYLIELNEWLMEMLQPTNTEG